MKTKRILKGKAIICVLNKALYMLRDLEYTKSEHIKMQKQAEQRLFSIIIHLGIMFSEGECWSDTYLFLVEAGIAIPDEINDEMRDIEQADEI